jgi:hypothetical protein
MDTKTKLTVRVNKKYIEGAKEYARKRDTSLSHLISEFLKKLSEKAPDFQETPILREMRGTLPQDSSVENYHEYLGKKYGE